MHTCPQCGKEPRKDQKYCSRECLHSSMRFDKRSCQVCGALFQPLRPSSKYCTLRCTGMARAVRRTPPPADVPGAKWIAISGEQFVLVDEAKYDLLSQYNWVAVKQRSDLADTTYYAKRTDYSGDKRKSVWMHRFILNAPPGYLVDHINGNGLDNRSHNLRLATHGQNSTNSRRKNSTGFRGVTRLADDLYIAKLSLDRKIYYAGRHKTAESAALAYDKMARRLQGQFARLNFPRPGELQA